MASLKDLETRWHLLESHSSEDCTKELVVGLTLRKMGVMAKPDCAINFDGNNITIKTESRVKTTGFSCTLGGKSHQADCRKLRRTAPSQMVPWWKGEESTIARKLKDGKMVVGRVMNNAICTWVYEKVECGLHPHPGWESAVRVNRLNSTSRS